jgi:signal transduction histidine kinase
LLNVLLKRLDGFFVRRSRRTILFISLISVVLLSVIAYFSTALSVKIQGVMSETFLPTPNDLLLLYLVPIFLASWYAGWQSGLATAVWAGVATFVTETITAGINEFQAHLLIALAVRTAAFLVIARVMARLQETRRQQEELTNFIVHDLRSPLASSIAGLLTIQQTSVDMEAEEREMVDLALINNNRALSLVNSILDVSKLESGKMVVDCVDAEVAPFIDECLEQVELWARGQTVSLDADVIVDRARFDPVLTGRILVNLLSNALKYSPEGGRILVRAGMSHGSIRFSVTDEGAGIPAEYVEVIFQPFGQVYGTTGGTGLGLTFCRLAVQAQGGRIWVESQLGKGTTMHFTIPQHGHGPSGQPVLES